MKPASMIVALFGAAYIGGCIAQPYASGDLIWQRTLGESILHTGALPTHLGWHAFTAVGAPWTPQEWLFALPVALFANAHLSWLFQALVGLAAMGALALVARRAAKLGVAPLAVSIAVMICAIALDMKLVVRAEVFAWAFFALLLILLDFDDRRAYWSIPLIVLWANVHASVMIAPVIMLLDAGVTTITRWSERGAWRVRWLLAGAALLAVNITPLGIRLPLYAIMLLRNPIRRYIPEWGHLTWHSTSLWFVFLPIVIGVALRYSVALRHPRDAARMLLLAVASISAVRHIPLFAMAGAPLFASAIDPLCARIPVRIGALSKRENRILAWGTLGVTGLVFLLGIATILRSPPGGRIPVAAVSAVAALPGEQRLLCSDYSWCSLALTHPNVRVFLDGRADPYPPRVWRAYVAILQGNQRSLSLLRRYRVNVVLAAPKLRLVPLLLRGRWRVIFRDPHYVVLVPASRTARSRVMNAAPMKPIAERARFARDPYRRRIGSIGERRIDADGSVADLRSDAAAFRPRLRWGDAKQRLELRAGRIVQAQVRLGDRILFA